MMVNFCDLIFLDLWLIQKKAKSRFVIPGTEGHPGYELKAWMKSYALPEHLLQWPFFDLSRFSGGSGGLGTADANVYIRRTKYNETGYFKNSSRHSR